MTPDVVVDIGNSRIKWGRCPPSAGLLHAVSLPSHDATAWDRQAGEWGVERAARWAVSGVHPERVTAFTNWARGRGGAVTVLDHWTQLGIPVLANPPEKVGLDRILNAVAARSIVGTGRPAVIADVGTAVTVDLLTEAGEFAGGTIFPGLRLMAAALNAHTAKLPLVEVDPLHSPHPPATDTVSAIRAGVCYAVAGGIEAITRQLAARSSIPPIVLVTGGDGAAIRPALAIGSVHSLRSHPTLTLEGIRIAAESLP